MATQRIDLSKKATWELERTISALSKLSFFNSPEDEKMIEAAKRELSTRRKQQKKR